MLLRIAGVRNNRVLRSRSLLGSLALRRANELESMLLRQELNTPRGITEMYFLNHESKKMLVHFFALMVKSLAKTFVEMNE